MTTIDNTSAGRTTGQVGSREFNDELREAQSRGGQLDENGVEVYKDYRGPYLEGKPPLAESNHQWKEEDIANVESEWLSTSGHRLALWDGLLVVTMKNGDQVLVHAGINPRLHQVAKEKMNGGEVDGAPGWTEKGVSEEQSLWLGQREAEGFEVVTSADQIPELGELRFIRDGFLDMSASVYHPAQGFQLSLDMEGAYGAKGTALFTTGDGKKYAVSEELSPQAYEAVKALSATRDTIEKKIDEGYKVMSPHDDIPVAADSTQVQTIAPGVKAIETPHRGKFIVIESHTPEHFSSLEGMQVEKQQSAVDKAFEERGLPPGKETDLMQAATTEEKDGRPKTVGELYYEKLKSEYGSKPSDSKEAKYLRLLEAQATLDGGFQFLPYLTHDGPYNTTTTSHSSDPKEMRAADMRGLVDEGKLGEELLKLMTDPEIAAGNERMLKESIDKVADKDGFKAKLVKTMLDPEYKRALEALENDNPEGAAARYSADMQSLNMLDPKEAQRVDTELKFGIPIEELNQLYAEGIEGIGEEALEKATSDGVSTVLTALFTSVSGAKRGADIFNYYFGGGKEKGQTPPDLSAEEQKVVSAAQDAREPLTEMIRDKARAVINDPSGQSTAITQQDVDRAMDKVPLDKRSGVAGVIGTLGKTGVLSSTVGMISMVAGVYKLADGGLNFGDTPAERIEAAKNFVTTMSVISPMATMVTGAYEEILRKPGAADALGLGKNLKETVWDKHFPSKESTGTPPSVELKDLPELDLGKPFTAESFWAEFDDVTRSSRPSVEALLEELPPEAREQVLTNLDKVADANPDLANVPQSDRLRWVGGALSTIGGMADVTGGVLDLVLGGMGIDKLRKEGGSPEEFAAKSLQIVSGVSSLVMGGAGLASALGVGSAAVAGLVGAVAGGAGAVLGFIAAIIGGVIALEKSKEAAGQVREHFQQLDRDGVLEEGWGEKLNYVIQSNYEYKYWEGKYEDRFDAWYPEDIPAWEAQPGHYDHFTMAMKRDGHIDQRWFDDTMENLVVHSDKFDAEFYREHKDKIDLLVKNWDQWQGHDDIITAEDFNKLINGDPRYNNTREEIDAVRFLMDNKEFFDFLDLIRFSANNSKTDGMISRHDLNNWLEKVS